MADSLFDSFVEFDWLDTGPELLPPLFAAKKLCFVEVTSMASSG